MSDRSLSFFSCMGKGLHGKPLISGLEKKKGNQATNLQKSSYWFGRVVRFIPDAVFTIMGLALVILIELIPGELFESIFENFNPHSDE